MSISLLYSSEPWTPPQAPKAFLLLEESTAHLWEAWCPHQAAAARAPGVHQAILSLVLFHPANKPFVGCNKHVLLGTVTLLRNSLFKWNMQRPCLCKFCLFSPFFFPPFHLPSLSLNSITHQRDFHSLLQLSPVAFKMLPEASYHPLKGDSITRVPCWLIVQLGGLLSTRS